MNTVSLPFKVLFKFYFEYYSHEDVGNDLTTMGYYVLIASPKMFPSDNGFDFGLVHDATHVGNLLVCPMWAKAQVDSKYA